MSNSSNNYYIIESTINSQNYSQLDLNEVIELVGLNIHLIRTDIYDKLQPNHSLLAISEDHKIVLIGLMDLINMKVDAINISFGYKSLQNNLKRAFKLMFDYAIINKVIPVVAVGNFGPSLNSIQELAKLNSMISVGATNSNMELQAFSSRGKVNSNYPTFVADGIITEQQTEGLKSIFGANMKTYKQGTSFSAPVVTSIVCGVRKYYQLIEALYNHTREIQPKISELHYGIVGIADDAEKTSIKLFSLEMQEIIKKEKYYFSVSFENREVIWFEIMLNFISNKDSKLIIVYSLESVIEFLKNISVNLESYVLEEVGYGYLSREICFDYISHFTPKRFTLEPSQM